MPTNDRIPFKTARQAAGLTQEQAAELSGVSIESWRAYEYGDRQLMAIAADGVIDESEQEAFDDIVGDLDGIVAAALAVKYPKGIKKDRPDAGTSRRYCSRPKSKNDRTSILSHRSENVNTFSRRGGAAL